MNRRGFLATLAACFAAPKAIDAERQYAFPVQTYSREAYTALWSVDASQLEEGDIITIAGVYAINPVSRF